MQINNDIDNDMKFLTKSEIRLKILNELNENPNSVRGLVKETEITYSSISNNISKLEKNDLITKVQNKYHITPMTEIYLKTLMDFKTSMDLVNDFDTFWNKHNLNQLSMNSIKCISDLKDSQLVETTPLDIYKTHDTIKNQITGSRNIRAIFPYLHPEYPKLIEKILNNGGSAELILPESISRELLLRINGKVRKDALKKGKLKIYAFKNELKLYLTICDQSMSLGLFKNDGSFDQNRILVSDKHKSNMWACELFEHVKTQVRK